MTKEQDKALLERIVSPLLEWYGREARDLPWRKEPKPYHIWLSEIIFQQTRIEAGTAYYLRFLQEVPGVKELAELPEEKLLKLWEGLGYYNRARNLQKAAKLVMAEYGGELPGTAAELEKLPGIGSYTAGAIASIAFGQPVPAVDGNVLRVLSRVLARYNDIALQETKKNMERELAPVIPEEAPGDFNQALMDLGAMVCIPNGEPRCGLCPLRGLCRAAAEGLTAELPVKGAAKARRTEQRTLLLLTYPGKDGKKRCFLRKREGKGLLAGLWEIPGAEGDLGPSEAKETAADLLRTMGCGPEAESAAAKAACKPLPDSKHVFSHVEWHMKAWEIAFPEAPQGNAHQVWATAEEVERAYSLPSAFKAYKKFLK
ncbi:MAG: A/G-specific adenine glycosylase [Clostridiales bacterium]|nr:A/G-specific adenine glycosylase [Clostridiales bacterium]